MPSKGLNSRLAKDLNATEKVVLTILEMGNTDSETTCDFGPIENDDDVPEEEEEEEMEDDDMIGLQNSPNGTFDSTSISKSYPDDKHPHPLLQLLKANLKGVGVCV